MVRANNLPYILSDLDGTISDSSLLINDKTVKDILAYQQASQGKFSLITGRLVGATKFLAEELKIDLPIVSCNGALVSDWRTGKIFHVKYLDSHLVIEIIRQTSAYGVEPIVYTTKDLAGLKNNHRIAMWKEYSHKLHPHLRSGILEFNDIESLVLNIEEKKIKPVQLVLYAAQKIHQEKTENILNHYKNKIEVTASFAHVFNVTAYGIDKLSGLKNYAKVLKINYRDVVVFGDSYNDISMLRGVKKGFVVANGVQKAKETAHKVIPSVKDNGVGKTLRQFIETGNHD